MSLGPKSMRQQRQGQGFSIVMVLVAAALMGLMAVAFSELISTAMKGQKSVQNDVDFDILKTSINVVLSSKACDGAFKNSAGDNVQLSFPATMPIGTNIIAAASPVPVQKIILGNSVIAEKGGNLGGGMKISKLEFTDAIYDGDQTLGTPAVKYKAFVATLNVVAAKTAAYGSQVLSKAFRVRLLTETIPSGGVVKLCGNVGVATHSGTICGGYTTKYPGGWCSGCTYAIFGCGVAGGSCPRGYHAIPSGYVTINNAENTWLCVKD